MWRFIGDIDVMWYVLRDINNAIGNVDDNNHYKVKSSDEMLAEPKNGCLQQYGLLH